MLALVWWAPAAGAAEGRAALGAFPPSLGNPTAIAVDSSTHDVLVVDKMTSSIARYHENGTAAPFSALGGNAIDGKAGADETPQGGLNIGVPQEVQLSVDNSGGATDGDIYLTQATAHLIDIFGSNGEYLGQLTEYLNASSEAKALGEVCGVATTPAGGIYVSDFSPGKGIHKYESTGAAHNPLVNADSQPAANFLSVSSPCTVASGTGPSSGALFVNEYIFPPFSFGKSFKLDAATGQVEYEISSGNTTITLDDTNGDVLLAHGPEVNEYDASGGSEAKPIWFENLGSKLQGVSVDGSSGHLYVSRQGSSQLEVFGELVPIPPRIEAEWVAQATYTDATVKARFGIDEEDTTYRLEYGQDTSYGQSSDVRTVGQSSVISVNVAGLQPGTTYHWRISATNANGENTKGPDRTVSTHAAPTRSSCDNEAFRFGAGVLLPDCRAYELVSPVDKNGGDVDGYEFEGFDPDPVAASKAIDQSALEGGALTYTATNAFADPESAPFVSQYLATRQAGSDGAQWRNEAIDPREEGGVVNGTGNVNPEFKAFSSDLRSGWLASESGLALAPCAVSGYSNLYRRNSGDGFLEAMCSADEEPEENRLYPEVQGVSEDGSHTVFRVNEALNGTGAVEGLEGRWQLYENAGGVVRLISVLPNGTAYAGNSSAGSENSEGAGYGSDGRLDTVAGAVSRDGKRVYWSRTPELLEVPIAPGPIYLRLNADRPQMEGGECGEAAVEACTLPVSDTVAPGKRARFWGAASDGSMAIFTITEGPLAGNLYEYRLASQSSILIAKEVVGVAGAGKNLARFYFASKEALDGAAQAGSPNLYLDENGSLTFIATLADEDVSEGGVQGYPSPVAAAPRSQISRVSGNGRYIAFVSAGRLTSYDNTDAGSERPDREVYIYEAGGKLLCASCNPSGQRPAGADLTKANHPGGTPPLWTAAWIPSYQAQLDPRHPLSEDGKRLFFNSVDPLLPRDNNGVQDVYEWEAPGSGTCTTSSPEYSSQNGGCISLISSGEGSRESEFVDASGDGTDVFIRTETSLSPRDPGLVDIYDARAGGGEAPPAPPAPSCEGDSCQSPSAAPGFREGASATYDGPGNPKIVKPKRCRKGRRLVRRHGKARCVKRHRRRHTHHRRHHKRARDHRRAAR